MRVTVASETRRVDLVLPGAVPVAELVPELARSVGLLDAVPPPGGPRLRTTGGRLLAPDLGLVAQGVRDGCLLTLSTGPEGEPPCVHDDVAEAMADVVERDLAAWKPGWSRPILLGAAGLLLVCGAGALLVVGSTVGGVAAGVAATLLVGGGVALSRARGDPREAVAVAWAGSLYAGVAGASVDPEGGSAGLPGAGAACLVAGLVALVGFGERRALLAAPVVAGVALLAAGLTTELVLHTVPIDPAAVATAGLVLVVLTGSLVPGLALAVVGATADASSPSPDRADAPAAVDPVRLAADARLAHDLLVAVSAAAGALLVLAAPATVSLGAPGTLLAALACLLVLLRTRRHRVAAGVLVGLATGVLGLVATGAAVWWFHPAWRSAEAVALAGSALVLWAGSRLPGRPSVRLGLLGDRAETAALLALPPLLVVATGLVAAVRG